MSDESVTHLTYCSIVIMEKIIITLCTSMHDEEEFTSSSDDDDLEEIILTVTEKIVTTARAAVPQFQKRVAVKGYSDNVSIITTHFYCFLLF